MKRLVTLLVLVPIGIIIVALAVANRQSVTLNVPPDVGGAPFYSQSIPVYALIFIALLVGMVIGSFATWVKQGKHRKQARVQKVEATKAVFEAEKQKERAEDLAQKVALSPPEAANNSSVAGLPAPEKAA